jgi:two-component system, OmpR family, response regulator
MRALVIEDDDTTGREITAELVRHGFAVEWANDGLGGLARASAASFDVITLDRLLPGLDGLSIVSELRAAGVPTPVLMISALGDVDERISGLRAGGDDYLVKPFALEEMVARIEVLLRRRVREADRAESRAPLVLKVRDLELDLLARTVRRSGVEIDLLPTEFRLLEFLVRNAGQVLSRQLIFEKVWQYYFDPGANLINVHVARLRRKLDTPGSPPLISTVRGSGYRLDADP